MNREPRVRKRLSLNRRERRYFGAVEELTVILSHGSLRGKLLRRECGRYWDRTSDLFRVKEARYPCANRPAGSILPQESRPQDALDRAFPSQHTRWGFVRGFVPRLEFERTRSCVRADVAQW